MKLNNVLDKLRTASHVVLELDLARGLLTAQPDNPLEALQRLNMTSLETLRSHLADAVADPRVRGLIVHVAPTGRPLAALAEAAEAIAQFGQRKPTIAWSESFGELTNVWGEYCLAAACDEIWLQPTGGLGIGGLEANIVLFKGALNKAGLEPQFGQRWQYKSAADQFAATEVSEANREMTTRIVESVLDSGVETIASRRRITSDKVWEAVHASPLSAKQALEAGLVDRLGYRDEVYREALQRWRSKPNQLRFVHRYQPPTSPAKLLRRWQAKQVAVVEVHGPIMIGRGASARRAAGSDVVDEQLRAALRDDNVAAVLLDVDSPGGSAVASDFIRRSVLQLREAGKPVVAQMGALAASGGYYVSMGCDEIVAQPTTLTGSIGVLAGKLVTQGLYDKLGVVRETVRTDGMAGLLSSTTEFTEEQWQKLNDFLDRVYLEFTTFAAADRGMAYEELEQHAKGRVWTGADAYSRGLVDHLGGRRTALVRIRELAALGSAEIELTRPGKGNVIRNLLPATSTNQAAGTMPAVVGQLSLEKLLRSAALQLGLDMPGVLTLPFNLELR